MSKQLGCSIGTVKIEADRHGIRIPASRIDVPESQLARSVMLTKDFAARKNEREAAIDAAVADYVAGQSLTEAAHRHGFSVDKLDNIVKHRGVKRVRPASPVDAVRADLEAVFAAQATVPEMAHQFGITANQVSRARSRWRKKQEMKR